MSETKKVNQVLMLVIKYSGANKKEAYFLLSKCE